MTEATHRLAVAANELTPIERLNLVDEILESLDATDPAMDALWAREAEDRLAAYRRGDIQAVPLEEVLEKYRRPCN